MAKLYPQTHATEMVMCATELRMVDHWNVVDQYEGLKMCSFSHKYRQANRPKRQSDPRAFYPPLRTFKLFPQILNYMNMDGDRIVTDQLEPLHGRLPRRRFDFDSVG